MPHHLLRILLSSCLFLGLTPVSSQGQIPTAGLRAWFRGDSGIELEGGVTVKTWHDRSSSNITLTQTGGTQAQPEFIGNAISGQPALRFDGGDVLQSPGQVDLLASSTDITVFVVVAPAASQVSSAQIVDFNFNASGGLTLNQAGAATNKYQFLFQASGVSQGAAAQAPLRPGRPQILSVVKNAGTERLSVNHAQVAGTAVSPAMTTALNVLAFGGGASSTTTRWKGDLAEVIIYNRALSDAERAGVNDYLDTRYGILPPLPIPKLGLRTWFNTNSGVTAANGQVSAWTDYVSGLTAMAPNSDSRPTLIDDGRGNPSIRFNGVNSILQTLPVDIQGGLDDLSVFVVMHPTSVQAPLVCVIDHDLMRSPDHGFAIEQDSVTGNSYRLDWFDQNGGRPAAGAKVTVASDEIHILSAIKSGTQQEVRVNSGTPNLTASVSGLPTDMVSGLNTLAIGGNVSNAARRFAGEVSGIVIYNRALTPAERQSVEKYLSDTHSLHGTKFQFALDQPSTTSAGVYTLDNRLIKTLWRKLRFNAGTITRTWDGKDDNGNTLSPGTFGIKVIAHDVQYVWDGLVGNTSTSLSGPSHHAGQGFVESLAINGTDAFYALGEQEGFSPIRHYKTDSPQTATNVVAADFRVNFDHVATDGVLVYYANKGAAFFGSHPSFVAASYVSDHRPYTFTNAGIRIAGIPPDPEYPSCIDVAPTPVPGPSPTPAPTPSKGATGLAVQKNGNILAVSHGNENVIRLFNKTTGQQLGSISVNNPTELAMTPSGHLWVVSGTSVKLFKDLGLGNTPGVEITGLVKPVAITVLVEPSSSQPPITDSPTQPSSIQSSSTGPRESSQVVQSGRWPTLPPEAVPKETLIVADAGSAQVLKGFNIDGSQAWTFPTVAGGYDSRGPDVTSDKFQFEVGGRSNPSFRTGLCATTGAVWVGDGATNRLLKLNATTGSLQDQIMFLTRNLGAVADPNAPTRLIGDGWLEFQVDYSKPLQQGGGWILRKNWAAGMSGLLGGLDEGLQEVTTLSNGRVYGTISDFSTGQRRKTVVELPATGNLRICKDASNNNLVLPNEQTASAYGLDLSQAPSLEKDGSLRFVRIANGRATWYQRNVSFDTLGNPRWGTPTPIASAPYVNEDPVSFNEHGLRQGRHPVTSSNILVTFDDTFRLSGHPPAKTRFPDPNAAIDPSRWKHLGGVALTKSDWSWKEAKTVLTNVPFDGLGSFDIGDNINYAGSTVMVDGPNVIYGFPGENWNSSEASQWMHFYENGLFVGQFGTPGTVRNPTRGAVPGFTGNSFGPTMVHVSGTSPFSLGETYLWADDKSLHSGVARWHLVGANTIQEFSGSVSMGGSVELSRPQLRGLTNVTATPGDRQITLTWDALRWYPGEPVSQVNYTYDIKRSTSRGGPYVTVASVQGTSCTIPNLENGTKYYFVVSERDQLKTSSEVGAYPFAIVGLAGQLTGGQAEPLQVSSAAPATGQNALTGLPAILGDLTRTDVGHLGYIIYNWADAGSVNVQTPVPFTTQSNLVSIYATLSGPWVNRTQYVANRFVIDGQIGLESGIDLQSAGQTGSINVNVPDTAVHYVTVVAPAYFARQRWFSIRITPQNQSSPAQMYTVNDAANLGENHIFQFAFTGNITLSVTNHTDTGATIQALFFD